MSFETPGFLPQEVSQPGFRSVRPSSRKRLARALVKFRFLLLSLAPSQTSKMKAGNRYYRPYAADAHK